MSVPFKTIRKSIELDASPARVWDVLILDEYNRDWFSEFSEGTYALTDWQVGSKVVFKDKSGDGMIGRISANEPGALLSVEYYGFISKGLEDTESEDALAFAGGQEIYRLSQADGKTRIDIEADTTDEYYDMMAEKWDLALARIKALAEA